MLRLKQTPVDQTFRAQSPSAPALAGLSYAARVDAAAADTVPAPEPSATSATCETLAEDAAQTTLMVVEFQRWYPHLSFADKVGSVEPFNLLGRWVPAAEKRKKILADNPQKLFGF